ncbi:hypothetical protein [Curtobacterium sp. BH-2-1-1]|nr:hypothetical protein [Curtobacterium sp. BH-2-1-1]
MADVPLHPASTAAIAGVVRALVDTAEKWLIARARASRRSPLELLPRAR